MRKIAFALLLLFKLNVFAQRTISYLTEKESHSILKESHTVLEILDYKNFKTKKKQIIIIKNKFARDLKDVHIFYDDFRKIKDAKVTIRNLNGKEIKQYKLKDFEDTVYDFSNINSDNRFKVLTPSITSYPFEIEITYEVHHSASLFYDFWQPQYDKMHIVNAQLKVIDHTKSNLRYLSKNIDEPTKLDNVDATIYHWTLHEQTARTYESFNNHSEDYFATVILAPIKFEMDGYPGELSSWASFGKWINRLNISRNNLDEEDIKAIKKLQLKKSTPLETIENVYRYLQETTRYISIQIGIGGFQPFKTKSVHKKKYGDCKALSFYTQSLLALFDIKSYYTLVNAGATRKDMDVNFPSAYFNHAILTVPVEKDTIFLECTSQTHPFGYAGTFTGNRKALLIDGNQSKVISTQNYTEEDNRQKTNFDIDIDWASGTSIVSLKKDYFGTEIEYQDFLNQYHVLDKKKVNWIEDTFKWGGTVKIDSFSLNPIIGNIKPKGGFKLVISNKKEGLKRGDRIFLSPQKYFTRSPKIPKENERKTPIRIRFGYQVTDSLTYSFDTNDFIIENFTHEKSIISKFGFYSMKISKKDNLVFILRTYQLNQGIYSAEDFENFKDFLTKVRKNDLRKLILKKNSIDHSPIF